MNEIDQLKADNADLLQKLEEARGEVRRLEDVCSKWATYVYAYIGHNK